MKEDEHGRPGRGERPVDGGKGEAERNESHPLGFVKRVNRGPGELHAGRPVEYRARPQDLTPADAIAEIAWLHDATSWAGALGDHARQRAALLRERLRREAGPR